MLNLLEFLRHQHILPKPLNLMLDNNNNNYNNNSNNMTITTIIIITIITIKVTII